MYEVTMVRLREKGKTLFYNARGIKFEVSDYVIIEADRGVDYGQVISESTLVEDSEIDGEVKAIVRKADAKDMAKINENKENIKEAFVTCSRKIHEKNLPMKLVEAEYSFDASKIVFYFTSEGRVDFRELVKDLASIFKVRIELRQIGVRDEAKMLGGIGHCGRSLCCVSYLKDFVPVTIRMAKEQKLSLNPSKISGTCGRLMCCLGYEFDSYRQICRNLPREGEKIKLEEGEGRVKNVDVLKRIIEVEMDDGRLVKHECHGCHCSMRKQKNKKRKTTREKEGDIPAKREEQ